tara:strand:+ start:69 stop:542 length:474 start_codon:yes stop_codon:yes gene_type:complete
MAKKKTRKQRAGENNPGKRPLGDTIDAPTLTEPPPPPPFLREAGRQLWEKVAAVWTRQGRLTILDLEALAVLCDAYQTWTELAEYAHPSKAWQESDNGYFSEHPALRARAQAAKTMFSLWRQFGLTPLMRDGMELHLGDEGAAEDDELFRFAARRGG